MGLIGRKVPISALFHDVLIQAMEDGTDASGFPIEVPVDLVTLPAAREPVYTRGAEHMNEMQIVARSFHRWTLPYHDAIDPDLHPVAKMRLVYEQQYFDILEVHVLNLRTEITMMTLVRAD